MKFKLQIIPGDLLDTYLKQLPKGFDALQEAEISSDTFSFYTSVASVFSSKIEGEDIELDSYIKHKKFGLEFLPDYTKKIDDLVFVKIHPWNDGNGRSARLYEKWFLAQKLGDKAWFVQSEKMYYNLHQTYYRNLRLLGLDYAELDYSQALSFLSMLPISLDNELKTS